MEGLMFNKIDSAILAGCTKLSHAIQRATGLTNYFIARAGIAVTAIAIVIRVVNYFHQFLVHGTSLFDTVLLSYMLVCLVGSSNGCAKADEQLWSGSRTKPTWLLGFHNERFLRVIVVVSLVLNALSLPITLAVSRYRILETFREIGFPLGMATFLYFVIVDPLPPGRSTVRKWLEALKAVRSPATAPAEG
jgi:hypothetical protein